jgi:hypothetical protein
VDRTVGVGAIGTTQTIEDLKDLIKAQDAQLADMGVKYATSGATWGISDPTAYKAWGDDYQALMARYNAAKDAANTAITLSNANFLLPASFDVSGDPPYKGITAALNHFPEQPGDMQDLARRLQAATGASNTPGFQMPQPHQDADMAVYNAAEAARKALGLPKDPNAAAAGAAAAIPWKTIGIVVGAALVGLIVVNKVIDKVL